MGVHVGQCISGLVGTTLPCYTLVGEAVETAKLMEATGEPMKIQVILKYRWKIRRVTNTLSKFVKTVTIFHIFDR